MLKDLEAIFSIAVMFIAISGYSLTETVNGITWTYTVANGAASVGGGAASSTAVPTSTTGAIMIPTKLGGYNVTSIGNDAFYKCSGLASVKIPNSVTSIGSSAFSGCSGLTSVEIPNSVTSIGNYAFYGCSGLKSVEMPSSVTSIGYNAFRDCSGLTSISMLGKMPSADSWTFPSGEWPIYVTEAWDGPIDTWQGHPIKLVRDLEVTVEGKALSIPGAWMAQYPSVAAVADDAGAAVEAVAANGRKVWECYALGLDPEKADEDFKIVSFPMKTDGTPDFENIVFDPPCERWNVQGARAVLQGASELGGEWRAVNEEDKASFRFFKVEVVLP